MVVSSQLRQFPQMIIALDKYTGYMFTSSSNCMMSSSVAMEILCITNIAMKMIRLQYTLAVKNKLNKQMKEYGVCMFCEVS